MVSKLPSRKILVTGSTGFIGANLISTLVGMGYSPHVIFRKNSNTWRIKGFLGRIHTHIVDLENKGGIRRLVKSVKPGIIYHCATYGGHYYQVEQNKIIRTNIIGTLNLLEACARQGFHCFINTGTSSEYGIKNKPMKESDLLEPITSYGIAKASATLFCQHFAREKHLPIVTLRLFSPYGYFDDSKRLVASTILSCLNKKVPRLLSPSSVRDFVFIKDVMLAYLKAALRINKISGNIINIGSGKQYSVGEVAGAIIRLTGLKAKPSRGFTHNPRIEPDTWVADISRAKNALGWKPKFDLDEGLKNTIAWYKGQ